MDQSEITLFHDLLRSARTASLGSLTLGDGTPFVSLVNLALSPEGYPLMLLSDLAWHSKNLNGDGRGSVLVAAAAPDGDALTGLRATVLGRFAKTPKAALRADYLRGHPLAEEYFDFGDFKLWQMMPETIHQVAGFGRIRSFAASLVFPFTP
jgi:heme iron utilization protein